MISRIGLAISLALALGMVAFGVIRVGWLEDLEVNYGDQTTLRESADGGEAVLGQVSLHGGTHAQFEICAGDPMLPERWADAMELQLRLDGEVGLSIALDEEALARVRRNETSGCLSLGSGPVRDEGAYVVAAVFDELPSEIADVPLRTRIIARRELGDMDLTVVVCVWLSSMLLVVFLALRAREKSGKNAEPASRVPAWGRVLGGLFAMLVIFFGIGFVGRGAAVGLASGVSLGVCEVLLGLALIGGVSLAHRADRCGLVAPERFWWAWFPAAGLAGVALMLLAQLSTRLVPSTSTSSVELFVSWPSGMLSFAALAVAAPLAEEVFFRGFVYGALKKYGTWVAFLGAWLTFVAFHGSQTWGQWGALLGIAVTGLGLTGIRAVSKSTLVAATAHLVYNGLLAVQAFL